MAFYRPGDTSVHAVYTETLCAQKPAENESKDPGTTRVSFFLSVDAKGTIREIVLPKGLDLDRPKRTRTSFTAEQLYRLELEFQRCQYVVGRERTELARQLNLSETQVRQKRASGQRNNFHSVIHLHLLAFRRKNINTSLHECLSLHAFNGLKGKKEAIPSNLRNLNHKY